MRLPFSLQARSASTSVDIHGESVRGRFVLVRSERRDGRRDEESTQRVRCAWSGSRGAARQGATRRFDSEQRG
jgi:hypothetical protein